MLARVADVAHNKNYNTFLTRGVNKVARHCYRCIGTITHAVTPNTNAHIYGPLNQAKFKLIKV